MISISLILYILALVCLFLAAVGFPTPRVNMGWLGMFFWLLGVVLATFSR